MNVLLITFSIIFIIVSLHAYYRDRIVKFEEISKPAKYIFIFYLLFFVYSVSAGIVPFIGEYLLFMIAFGIYLLMSGNILTHIKEVKRKEF